MFSSQRAIWWGLPKIVAVFVFLLLFFLLSLSGNIFWSTEETKDNSVNQDVLNLNAKTAKRDAEVLARQKKQSAASLAAPVLETLRAIKYVRRKGNDVDSGDISALSGKMYWVNGNESVYDFERFGDFFPMQLDYTVSFAVGSSVSSGVFVAHTVKREKEPKFVLKYLKPILGNPPKVNISDFRESPYISDGVLCVVLFFSESKTPLYKTPLVYSQTPSGEFILGSGSAKAMQKIIVFRGNLEEFIEKIIKIKEMQDRKTKNKDDEKRE